MIIKAFVFDGDADQLESRLAESPETGLFVIVQGPPFPFTRDDARWEKYDHKIQRVNVEVPDSVDRDEYLREIAVLELDYLAGPNDTVIVHGA
jgi:hypothetical protein